MVAWSSILSNNISKGNQTLSLLRCSGYKWLPVARNCVPIRHGHHGPRTLLIRETEFTWAAFKNLFSLYFLIGLIPTIGSILYSNFFVGPPVLALIPEDYEPKYWEYYRNPVSRFLARYVIKSPQEKHERNLHVLYLIKQNELVNQVKEDVDFLMGERQDYQAWYFTKPMIKYVRREKELSDEYLEKYGGRNMQSVDN